eukprot:4072824-Pleurochrysis_carterae.AAC.1
MSKDDENVLEREAQLIEVYLQSSDHCNGDMHKQQHIDTTQLNFVRPMRHSAGGKEECRARCV